MKKLILLCVLLMGCTADPLPQVPQVVEVPPIGEYLIAEYIDLKFENERLMQELEDAGRRIGELEGELGGAQAYANEKRTQSDNYETLSLYLLQWFPEEQREILLCDGWNGFVVHFADKGITFHCINFEKMIDFVLNDVQYPNFYPDFYRYPEHEEEEETPCIKYCDNVVEQDEYPEEE